MVHTSHIQATALVSAFVVLILGAAPADAQERGNYCGLEFARAVFNQCAMAKRSGVSRAAGQGRSTAMRDAREDGDHDATVFKPAYPGLQILANDAPAEWLDELRQESERFRPSSLRSILWSNRFRRSTNAGDMTMGQYCCVYGCTRAQLATVC